MKLKTNPGDVGWWFWAVTLAFIVATVAGWPWGHIIVIVISAAQVLYFAVRERSLTAFPSQVRIVYFAFTLFGLSPAARLPIYLVLLVGTFMVTFFDRCVIAPVLKEMPWNRGRELRLG